MWHEGTIGVPKGDGKYTVVHYWVKAYDESSQYGIDGGRISKATLKIKGEVVYNYDRGAGCSATKRGSGNGAGDPDA